ncbi:glycosyltransferase family 71 protein [[Candida] arabinofermentans NRRL YB-2248]|uniref:Glycosyltransferase family 71 protein n=1 Tax=[Candida] arabinofermentans NRRL YB-2248 TaxID=983967 RepID=A0A1E4SZD6_9ASCO|nr:glycosyltransferase family 71 protein [[Candida] arabinofermentans NRRL YB-2248]
MTSYSPRLSFLSSDQKRSLFIYEKRLKRYIKNNKKVLWGIAILFFINFFYNLNASSSVYFELDDEYLGTYKEKYLRTIKNKNEIYTNDFYNKLKIMGYLDDLVNEPIEDPSSNTTVPPYEILKKFYPNPEDFKKLSTSEQAKIYVNQILPQTNFKFKPIQDTVYRDVYYPKKYLDSRLTKWLKIKDILTEQELETLEINDDLFKESVLSIKNKKIEFNENSSKEIQNFFQHLKLFSKFFLKPSVSTTTNKDTSEPIPECHAASAALLPWLSNTFPTFTKYNQRMEKTVFHPFGEDISVDQCFVQELKSRLSGKGIVITTTNGLVPELTGLLSLLRILNTQLPIQIIHNDDLSLDAIKKLVEVATEPVMNLPKPTTYKISKVPTLDLTFVDVSKSITYKYKSYFSKWGMKLLAYLFNSFEEMIMLDTDTVPLLPLEQYFSLPAYKETETLFFRDREANSFLYDGIMDFFVTYLNGEEDFNYLQLRQATPETLNNRFFGEKARHYMEAGLFAINKKDKFDGVLSSVTQQFFKLISGSLHGEKEFIWLGQEIMGQTYKFNDHAAASIGELTNDRGDLVAKELCSTHPGHLSNDGQTLLWFNSGFLSCKKPDSYYKDINYERNEGKSLLDLKKEYLSPLRITSAVIPPPAEYSIENDGSQEPGRGWVMTSQCENYLWCAYDVIGGGLNTNIPKGEIYTFSANDVSNWEYFGQTWVRYFQFGKTGSKADNGYLEDDAFDELGLDDYTIDDDLYDSSFASDKKPSTGGKTKTGNQFAKGGFASNSDESFDAPDKDDEPEPAAKKADSSTAKKPKTGVKSSKKTGKKTGKGSSRTLPGFKDADFIDEDTNNSGKSKGFKETDELEDELNDDDFDYQSSRKSSKKSKSKSSDSKAPAEEKIISLDSSLTKASENINSFFNSFGLGVGTNKVDSKKLSSFADDSEIDLDDIANAPTATGVASSDASNRDVLREQLFESLKKDNAEVAPEEKMLEDSQKVL